ncbi:MAG: DegT/DnrJ/EryC1/StrS family aminotransferase [Chloroflexi bacterium]|nr:DegT/DnrJ/EryC1/StrS family aminotransferase [Chloroflexota bacterium]
MIELSQPYLGPEERAAVLAVLDSGWLAQGKVVAEFEECFAAATGSCYAVATSSGTTALQVALLAHGIGPGDEVITTPFSFVATANVILAVGARPVFADIEPDTFNLSPLAVAQAITPRTRAILPVHLFGHPADLPALLALADQHGLAVIQDACQSHGAAIAERPLGEFGTACYSFYPTKNITSGEGGMVTTDDAALADRARLIRDHGMRERYLHEVLGFNFRMTDLHAALGLAQLRRLDQFTQQRIANADRLSRDLAGVADITLPVIRPGYRHVFHQYTIRVAEERDAFVSRMRDQGVRCGVYYPRTIPQQPVYRTLGYQDACPNAEAAAREVVSLPVHPGLSADDLDAITAAVRRCR